MILKSLYMKNIRVVKELSTDFTPGLTLVQQPNMSGKTTALFSILFALGGTKAIPKLTKHDFFRRGTKESLVRLVFSIGDEQYTIERTRTKAELLHFDGVDHWDKVANGVSVVNKAVEELLGTSVSDMLLTASTVVKVADPKEIEDAYVGFRDFKVISDILSDWKNTASNLLQELSELPEIESLSEEELKDMETLYNEAISANSLADDAATKLRDNDVNISMLQRLHDSLHELEKVKIPKVTDNDLAKLRETMEKINRYTSAKRALDNDPFAGATVDPLALERVSEFNDAQRGYLAWKSSKELYEEATSNANLPFWYGSEDDIKAKQEELGELQATQRDYLAWDNAKPLGKVSDELLNWVRENKDNAKKLADDRAKAKVEQKSGICSACGTVLSPDKVEEATKTLAKIPEFVTTREVDRAISILDYPAWDRDMPDTEAISVLAKEILAVDKYERTIAGCTYDPNSPPIPKPTLDPLDREVTLNFASVKLVEEHNQKVRELKDIVANKPTEVVTSEDYEEAERNRRAYEQHQASILHVKGDLATTPDPLPESEVTRLKGFFDSRVQELPPFKAESERRVRAVAREQERAELSNALLDTNSDIKAVNKSLVKVRAVVWERILNQASLFCSSVTDGRISKIGRENTGFYYVERGHQHSVSAGSGLQRTLIGLSIYLTLKALKGNSLPILLDEVTGRLDSHYKQKFIELLDKSKYQSILVIHGVAVI